MNNPSIEIAWGGGVWRKNRKRVVEQPVRNAKDLATYGIEDLGVSYQAPKRLTVFQVAKNCRALGVSNGSETMDLHIPVHLIKHRKVAGMLLEFAMTIVHETTHCIRSENHDDEGLIETAASEGLAYVSEDLVSDALLPPDETFFYGNIIDLSSNFSYESTKRALADQSNLAIPNTDQAYRIYDEWFGLDNNDMPTGVKVGVTEVYRRLAEGNEFADIINWPTEEILGLGSEMSMTHVGQET